MAYLTCEHEWNTVLRRMRQKVLVARTRAVTMEVRDMVSRNYLSCSKILTSQQGQKARKARGKQREKRGRDEDIPQEPEPEIKHQYECLLELQKHLFCHAHSRGGLKTYCWVQPATENQSGGHREMTHEEMTLWAKHMVSERLLVIGQRSPK